MRSFKFLLVATLFATPLAAQEEEGVVSFIRESRPASTATTARPSQILPRNQEDLTATDDQVRPPDPETIIVALVNGHVMTRAELDRKVHARLAQSEIDGTAATFGDQGFAFVLGSPKAAVSAEASRQSREDLDRDYMDMVLRMEGEIVEEWVEYKILSDEARRQGLIISEREFQARLDEITKQYELNARSVDQLLRDFGMSRADLEADISDALLIDKLLERYVEINKPDEFLRVQYERRPELFITPPSYRIAHFTISVPEARLLSTNQRIRRDYFSSLEKMANTVRSRLRSGRPAEEVFAEFNDPQNGVWGTVLDTNLTAGSMPDNLRKAILELKEGDTSPVQQVLLRYGADVVPETYHIIRLEKINPPGGTTFRSALPLLRKMAKEAAREELLAILTERGSTHRRMTNLGGLKPERLPDRAELMRPKPGIDLRIGAMSASAPSPARPRR